MSIMRELVVATTNKGKLREIKGLLKSFDLEITSLSDYPDAPDIVEDGTSFCENALKKAETMAHYTGKLTLGEDSGLEVEALDNQPGIYSARFSGSDATDERNNRKLLESMKDVREDRRKARYVCCAALVDGKNIVKIVEERCEGMIAMVPKGNNGFGYDPLFYLPQYHKTFGELDPSVKERISHRARAFEKIIEVLESYLKA